MQNTYTYWDLNYNCRCCKCNFYAHIIKNPFYNKIEKKSLRKTTIN